MKSFDQLYQAFWQLLEEQPPRGDAPADFPAIFRRLRVVPGVFNEFLLRQTGYCGEEIILIW